MNTDGIKEDEYWPELYRCWDALPQVERDAIRQAVLASSQFLRQLYWRDLHSALVLAACLVELDRRRVGGNRGGL